MSRALELVVINLERSVDRRAAMADQLERLGLPYRFFKAVDASKGEHLTFEAYDPAILQRKGRRPLAPGEIGVAASHAALWQQCIDENRPLIVMEDDIAVEERFRNAARIVEPLLREYPFIRLFGLVERPMTELRVADDDFHVVRYARGPLGLQCYAIAPAAAGKLLKHLAPLVEPIDDFVDRFWIHSVMSVGLLPYAVSDAPSVANRSTIETSRRNYRRSLNERAKREYFRMGDNIARLRANLVWRLRGS